MADADPAVDPAEHGADPADDHAGYHAGYHAAPAVLPRSAAIDSRQCVTREGPLERMASTRKPIAMDRKLETEEHL